MSAWSVSHCLSVSVFLVGHLGSCWGGLAGGFHACCPVSLNSLICLDVSLVSDGVGIQSSSVSGGCQLDVFPWVFQDSASNLSDLLLVFCCKIYQISFWFFFNTIFYQDCTSCQLASKDTNRSWVGSRDSKGDGQYYLDYSIWYNIFRYREV